MPSLSSLIVQRHVATVQEVEQAIARQVMHGGDLVTNLLEVAPHCEQLLAPVLGESVGLTAAAPGRLPAPDSETLDDIPAEMALGHGFFPLQRDGLVLVVATPAPVAPAVERALQGSLGLQLIQLAAPSIRVREGIAAHYGIPLEPRQLQLVKRLDAAVHTVSDYPRAPAIHEHTAPLVLPKAPSFAPSTFMSGLPGPYDALAPSQAPSPSVDDGWAHEPEPELPREAIPPVAHPEEVDSAPPRASAPTFSQRWDEPAVDAALRAPNEEADAPAAASPSSIPPSSAFNRQTISDPDALDRADALRDEEPPPSVHGRETVPTPIDVLEVLDQARAPTEVAPVPPRVETTEHDAMTRRAPEVEPLPSTAPYRATPDALTEPAEEDSPPPPSILNRRALHHLLRREVNAARANEGSARRRGPFPRPDAEKELESAASADQLIDVFFAFASQYFEYSALFRLQGDIAEGRDAWGPGAPREKVLGLGVPLDLPSSFSRAREQGSIILTRMNEDDLDVELLSDLGRPRPKGVTRAGAIVPVSLKSRVVALLYGDDRDRDVTVVQVGDLFGFTGLVAQNLERIALTKKRGGQAPPKVRGPARGNPFGPAGPAAVPVSRPQSSPPYARPSEPPVARVSPGAESVKPPPIGRHAAVVDMIAMAKTELPSTSPERASDREPLDRWDLGPSPAPQRASRPSGPSDPTRPYDEVAFHALGDAPLGKLVSPDPVHVSTLVGQGDDRDSLADVVTSPIDPIPALDPRVYAEGGDPGAAAHRSPLRREEDEDASRWIVDQSQSPSPPPVRAASPVRSSEYMIIPDRSPALRPEVEAQRAREAAMFGPYGALLMKAGMGGLQGEEALAELAREAEHDLPRIVAVFPGPLLVDRLRLRDQIPPASQCGPLMKLLVMLRRTSVGHMTVRSASPEVEHRFWATHVLGELLFPEASSAVLPRLFDDDVMVRRVARRAAVDLVAAGAAGEPLKRSLANMITNADEPVHRRVLAIEALGEMRAAPLIPALIGALGDVNDTIIETARRSLLLITRQDLGPNAGVWHAWWDANKHKNRIEWLIDALTHETPSLRRAAGDELKQLTNEYFGYYDDLPPRERERAQQKYREWWRDEGQFRFQT